MDRMCAKSNECVIQENETLHWSGWQSNLVQSNLNGSNIFGTMEIRSRHGYFESLRVNHGTSSGSK